MEPTSGWGFCHHVTIFAVDWLQPLRLYSSNLKAASIVSCRDACLDGSLEGFPPMRIYALQ